jgi:hypothetical protein
MVVRRQRPSMRRPIAVKQFHQELLSFCRVHKKDPSPPIALRPPSCSRHNRCRFCLLFLPRGSEFRGALPGDGEGPIRQITFSSFCVSKFAVTNEQFAEFVHKTHYRT